jgi:hypothetical protein
VTDAVGRPGILNSFPGGIEENVPPTRVTLCRTRGSRPISPYREDRIAARYLALCLGLRVETCYQRDGQRVYALWPEDGYAWELADPPVGSTWAAMRRILGVIWTHRVRLPDVAHTCGYREDSDHELA